VKTIYTKANGTIQGTPLELTIKISADQKMAVEMTAMGMSMMKQVVNDKEAYMIQQGQRIDIEGEDYQDMKKGAVPFDELNLINNADIKLTGIESVNGTEAYAVKNDDTTLYFDIKTGYKIAEAKEMEQMGQKTTQTTYYGDYKDVK